MAVWKNINPGTGGSLRGSISYDGAKGDSFWEIRQDETPFKDEAARERSLMQKANKTNMKKFATIPDIVAIEIAEKYGINIHDPLTSGDTDKMKRFKHIIMTEYKHLVVNNA